MKNFETNYPVEGTSALQPKLDPALQCARIIAFPGRPVPMEGGSREHAGRSTIALAVRTGTAQGVSFGRVQRWQAVVGGCAFAALSFASLFMGL